MGNRKDRKAAEARKARLLKLLQPAAISLLVVGAKLALSRFERRLRQRQKANGAA